MIRYTPVKMTGAFIFASAKRSDFGMWNAAFDLALQAAL
jgi:hypothetical protein